MSEPFVLTKDRFDSLFLKDITKKEYETINNEIAARVDYVIRDIGKVQWWDFIGGSEDRGGDFMESFDGEYLALDGQFTLPEPYYGVYNWFPIHWLWQDYKQEAQQEIEKYKAEQKNKKEQSKIKRELAKTQKAAMKEIISNKLTKEELKFITFK